MAVEPPLMLSPLVEYRILVFARFRVGQKDIYGRKFLRIFSMLDEFQGFHMSGDQELLLIDPDVIVAFQSFYLTGS